MTTLKKQQYPKIAVVVWKDACGYETRNYDIEELESKDRRSVMVVSTGIVLHDDEEGVALAQSINMTDDKKPTTDYPLCIPKEYIKKKKYLK